MGTAVQEGRGGKNKAQDDEQGSNRLAQAGTGATPGFSQKDPQMHGDDRKLSFLLQKLC